MLAETALGVAKPVMSGVAGSAISFHVIVELSWAPLAIVGAVTVLAGNVRSANAGGVPGSVPVHADVSLPVLSKSNAPAAGALPGVTVVPVIKLYWSVLVEATPAISLFGIVMSKRHFVVGVAPVVIS